MKIQLAKETECAEVIAFYHELICDMQKFKYHPTWIIGIYPDDEYLKRLTESGQVFLGVENDRIIAAMVLNNDPNDSYASVPWQVQASAAETVIVHLLGVLPTYWGKGYGKELLIFAEQYAESMGQKVLRLDVMEENLPARRLYEQVGFTEVETKKMYYESTGWSGFVMFEKALQNTV